MSGNLALHAAITTALRADGPLQALIGNPIKLFEDVQPSPAFAYIVIGETDDVPELAECIDGWEIFVPIHIYSRTGGFEEAKQIGAAIDAVLHNAALSLTGYALKVLERDSPTRYVKAPDNTTVHGLVTFLAKIEPT
jgi:hypothetical protein